MRGSLALRSLGEGGTPLLGTRCTYFCPNNMQENNPENNYSKLVIAAKERIEDYLENLNALLDKEQLNPLFLDGQKINSSLNAIRLATFVANADIHSQEEMEGLLESYHEMALIHVCNAGSYRYTFNDEKHENFQNAAWGFATIVNVPKIKIADAWLSGIPSESQNYELSNLCNSRHFILTEDEKKQLEEKFFSDGEKSESSSDNILEIYREAAGNSFKNSLDLLFENLAKGLFDSEEVDCSKTKDSLSLCYDFEYQLAQNYNYTPEQINSILGEYHQQMIKILGNTLKLYYSEAQGGTNFINELIPIKRDYLNLCLRTADYLRIGKRECFLKILDFFKEEERKNILIATKNIFKLDDTDLSDIRKRAKIYW